LIDSSSSILFASASFGGGCSAGVYQQIEKISMHINNSQKITCIYVENLLKVSEINLKKPAGCHEIRRGGREGYE